MGAPSEDPRLWEGRAVRPGSGQAAWGLEVAGFYVKERTQNSKRGVAAIKLTLAFPFNP